MRWTGRLERRALEGGTWVLHTPRGPVVVLGAVDPALDGAEVVVDGEAIESFGIAMLGPQVEARSVRRVKEC